MPDNTELVASIRELALRLDHREVTFIQVFEKVNQRMLLVTGDPHLQKDEEVASALERLAEALVQAFLREQNDLICSINWKIGYGVSRGLFGPDFFSSLFKR